MLLLWLLCFVVAVDGRKELSEGRFPEVGRPPFQAAGPDPQPLPPRERLLFLYAASSTASAFPSSPSK